MGNTLISSILFENAFMKTRFLTNLINALKFPVIFLDFDLLFSGYVMSETIKRPNENIRIIRPTSESFEQVINDVIHQIINKKMVLVIDSLNVLSNFFSGKNSGRKLNAYLMMLASISNHSDSKIFFASVAKKKDGMWVLTPTNRHIINSDKMLKIFVAVNEDSFDLEVTNENFVKKFSVMKDR